MLARLLLAVSLCTAPIAARADALASALIASVEAGIICPPSDMGSAPAPDTLAGTTHILTEEPPFAAAGTRVPAVLGLGFGIKSQSTDPTGIVGVTMVVTHPPMGASGATTQRFQTSISGQAPSLTFYQFDHKYELVLGTWTMTAFAGEEALFSVSFDVVDPRQLPELASVCNYLDLLS